MIDNEINNVSDAVEIPSEVEIEMYNKINYLVEKINEIYQLLNKVEAVEEVTEIDTLDNFAYKAKVLKNNKTAMIKIGKIDELGVLELLPIETHAPIVPSFYQPEFYYLGMESKDTKRYGVSHTQPNPIYKKFVPKNVINQIVISKEDIKYSTGYIDVNGVAVYYDQLPNEYKNEMVDWPK